MNLIASASHDMFSRYGQILQPFGAVLAVNEYGSLKTALAVLKPNIMLLELCLPGLSDPKCVADLCSLSSLTKIIVFSACLPDEIELDLFIFGVRACCRDDIDTGKFKRIAAAVEQGEFCIRRSLVPRFLEELRIRLRADEQPKPVVARRLPMLTQREQEIAALVGGGNSNKLIARRLNITERTVKAHLTEIFRKLGITDRLMLALRVIAPNETERSSADAAHGVRLFDSEPIQISS